MLQLGHWKLLLILIAMTWGVGFPLTKDALAELPVFSFLCLRFGLAALCFLPWILVLYRKKFFYRDLLFGFGVGVPLALGYILQTMGLERTSVTHTAFLTGLYAVFTPLLEWGLVRKPPSARIALACLVALAGLWLISGIQDFQLHFGDVLVVLCALSFSFQMLWLSHPPKDSSSTTIAFSQLAAVSLLTAPTAFLMEGPSRLEINGNTWMSVLFMAVIGSALAFYVQTRAQKLVSPAQVALLILTEPLWGALAGAILSNERLAWTSYVGGLLILSAVLISEIKLDRFFSKDIAPKRHTQKKANG